MHFIKIYFYIIFLFFIRLKYGYSINNFNIIAKVNNKIITNYDLNQHFNITILKLEKYTNDNDFIKNTYLYTLNSIIDEKLIEENAKFLGIKIKKNEIKNTIKTLCKDMNISKNELMNMLKYNEIDYEKYKNSIKAELILKQMKNLFLNNIKISKKEIENEIKHYQIIKKNNINNNNQIKLAEIVLNIENNIESFSKTIKIINTIFKKKTSKNFKNLAKTFSQSATNKNGGMIGWINIQDLSPKIRNIVNKTKINQICQLNFLLFCSFIFYDFVLRKCFLFKFDFIF